MKFSEHKEKKKKGTGINFMILFVIFLINLLLRSWILNKKPQHLHIVVFE